MLRLHSGPAPADRRPPTAAGTAQGAPAGHGLGAGPAATMERSPQSDGNAAPGAAAGDASRKPQLPLIGRFLVAASILACAVILALIGSALYEERSDALHIARQTGASLHAALSSEIAGQLGQIDLVLQVVASDLSDPNIAALPERARHALLARTARFLGRGGSLLVIDASGRVVLDAARYPPRAVDVADRDYFRVQRDAPGDAGPYVSAPFESRLNHGILSVALSRPVIDSTGHFAGIVVMTVPLDFFRTLFRDAPHSPGTTMLLMRTGGQLIVRTPPLADGVDTGADLRALAPDLFDRLEATPGSDIIARSPVTGDQRLFVSGPVPGLPLSVIVSQPLREIYAVWTLRVLIIGTMALVACGTLIVLAVLLRRELVRRLAAEAEMAEMAITDALTGLANRRRFNEVIAREWRRTARTGTPLGLLLIDADHFKRLNDAFGHARGDLVLRMLAQIILSSIRRPGDLGARYGGEEFAVVLPDTDLAGASLIAEKIRAAMAAESARLAESGLAGTTVSIGAASTLPSPGRSLEELVETADQALYAAKAEGRNRVVARACL